MDRSDFLKLLAKRFYPVLRAEGFRGSGTTLRRFEGEAIHVFNCQGSSTEGRFYINLGAHFAFLPAAGGGGVAPDAIKEYDCEFRKRLLTPRGSDSDWTIGATDDECEAVIDRVASQWEAEAKPWFRRYVDENLSGLINEPTTEPRYANKELCFARIALHLGDRNKAAELTQRGIANCPERATGLLATLEEFLREVESG